MSSLIPQATLATLANSPQPWLVGVSGGGDSTALLHLLIAAGLQNRIHVGTFNHAWSNFGPQSVAFVKSLCEAHSIPFHTATGNGKSETNAEESARTERYTWMKSLCETQSLAGVIVAHNQDDIAESFLMRAGKGSGLSGLAAMRESSHYQGLPILRPLLNTSRAALRDYLIAQNQNWLEDPDNTLAISQRARIRQLLPQLEAVGIRTEALAASAQALAQAEDALHTAALNIPITATNGTVTLARATLINLQPELAARTIARTIHAAVPGTQNTLMVRRSKRIALAERICTEPTGASTLHGAKFVWTESQLTVTPEK
ncbi:MAG: tRNA lysidine(34) synthetase TilS [Pseudomonas fluorescens]|nr:MAG: tRNA lysidine(34) synthetase TilS [Pseudomonas fluorescens]